MYPIEEIICEIRRELGMRQSFYPVVIAKGDLDQAEAARRIGIMEDILEHYLALEEDDREQSDLFLKAVPMRWRSSP
jgi:hypothetical protein